MHDTCCIYMYVCITYDTIIHGVYNMYMQLYIYSNMNVAMKNSNVMNIINILKSYASRILLQKVRLILKQSIHDQ